MVYLEASLHELLINVVDENDDTMSTFFRELLIKDLAARNRLPPDLHSRLHYGATV